MIPFHVDVKPKTPLNCHNTRCYLITRGKRFGCPSSDTTFFCFNRSVRAIRHLPGLLLAFRAVELVSVKLFHGESCSGSVCPADAVARAGAPEAVFLFQTADGPSVVSHWPGAPAARTCTTDDHCFSQTHACVMASPTHVEACMMFLDSD